MLQDLSNIVRTLEFWKPFYVEGRKSRSKDQRVKWRIVRTRADGHAGEVEKQGRGEGNQSPTEQIRRSGRIPKPRKLVDNSVDSEL